MENSKKLKVVFVTSDIREVNGGQICLLNYLRNAPKDIDISIVDFKDPSISFDYNTIYSNILSDTNLKYIGIPAPRFINNKQSSRLKIVKVLNLNILYPILFKIKYKNLIKQVRGADIIYFINSTSYPSFIIIMWFLLAESPFLGIPYTLMIVI